MFRCVLVIIAVADESAPPGDADGADGVKADALQVRAQADLRGIKPKGGGRESPDLTKRAKPRGLPEIEKPLKTRTRLMILFTKTLVLIKLSMFLFSYWRVLYILKVIISRAFG